VMGERLVGIDLAERRIEAKAKRRLADEYDAAQERGEVQSHGGDKSKIPDGNVALGAAMSDDGENEPITLKDAAESDRAVFGQ